MSASLYPRAVRPYWKSHSREQDEKLAKDLFFGTSTINKKTGRWYSYYLPKDSPDERHAFEALRRLLSHSCGDLEPAIFAALLNSLNSKSKRRLVFKNRKRGKSDHAADLDIHIRVEGLIHAGWPTEAAVAQVGKDLGGLSRKAIYAARSRVKQSIKP